jgi:hypothetical protein
MKSRLISPAFLVGVALVAASASAVAETITKKDVTTDVIGLMNFETGVFTPLRRAMSDAAIEGGVYNGWVVANITAVNKSHIPTTGDVTCTLDWEAYDSETFAHIRRFYATRARVTATTISCTVKVPYTLRATNQNTTTISLSPALGFYDEMGFPRANAQAPGVSFTLPDRGSTTIRSFSTYL